MSGTCPRFLAVLESSSGKQFSSSGILSDPVLYLGCHSLSPGLLRAQGAAHRSSAAERLPTFEKSQFDSKPCRRGRSVTISCYLHACTLNIFITIGKKKTAPELEKSPNPRGGWPNPPALSSCYNWYWLRPWGLKWSALRPLCPQEQADAMSPQLAE